MLQIMHLPLNILVKTHLGYPTSLSLRFNHLNIFFLYDCPHKSLAWGEASAQPPKSNKLADKSTDLNFVLAAAAWDGCLLSTKINWGSNDNWSFSSPEKLVFLRLAENVSILISNSSFSNFSRKNTKHCLLCASQYEDLHLFLSYVMIKWMNLIICCFFWLFWIVGRTKQHIWKCCLGL